jgi:DNA-binding MarR family transcriptional regulator
VSVNESLDQSPIHLLHRAGQCAEKIFETEFAMTQVTPRQYAVLNAVAAAEGANQTNLVEATGIDRSTLADIVRRLTRKGLIQRRRTREDARAYAVRLTDQGRRLLAEAGPVARRADERVLEILPQRDRKHFLASLAAIVARLASDAAQRK